MARTCLLCGKISEINALRYLFEVLTHCKGQVTMVTNQQRAGFLLPDADHDDSSGSDCGLLNQMCPNFEFKVAARRVLY